MILRIYSTSNRRTLDLVVTWLDNYTSLNGTNNQGISNGTGTKGNQLLGIG
jgi:hypothetical protein